MPGAGAEIEPARFHVATVLPFARADDSFRTFGLWGLSSRLCQALIHCKYADGSCRFRHIPRAELEAEAEGAEDVPRSLAEAAVTKMRQIASQVSGVDVVEEGGLSPRSRKTKPRKKSADAGTVELTGEEVAAAAAATPASEPWGTPDVFIVMDNFPASEGERVALSEAAGAAAWPAGQQVTTAEHPVHSVHLLACPGTPQTGSAMSLSEAASPRSGRKGKKLPKGDPTLAVAALEEMLASLQSASLLEPAAWQGHVPPGDARCSVLPAEASAVESLSDVEAKTAVATVRGVLPQLLSSLYAIEALERLFNSWKADVQVQEMFVPPSTDPEAAALQQRYEACWDQARPGQETSAGVLAALLEAVCAGPSSKGRATPRSQGPSSSTHSRGLLPPPPPEAPDDRVDLARVSSDDAPWCAMASGWMTSEDADGSGSSRSLLGDISGAVQPVDSIVSGFDERASADARHALQDATLANTGAAVPDTQRVFRSFLAAVVPNQEVSATQLTSAFEDSAKLGEREAGVFGRAQLPATAIVREALARFDILRAAEELISTVDAAWLAVELGAASTPFEPPSDAEEKAESIALEAPAPDSPDLLALSPGSDVADSDTAAGTALHSRLSSSSPSSSPGGSQTEAAQASLAAQPDVAAQVQQPLNPTLPISLRPSAFQAEGRLSPAQHKLLHHWSFADRRYKVVMSGSEVSQRVLEAMRAVPGACLVREQLSPHGLQLLAVHAPTPRARRQEVTVDVKSCLAGAAVLPSFAEWKRDVLPDLSLPEQHTASLVEAARAALAGGSGDGSARSGKESPRSPRGAKKGSGQKGRGKASDQAPQPLKPPQRPQSPQADAIPRCHLSSAVSLSVQELDELVASRAVVRPRKAQEGDSEAEAGARQASQALCGVAGCNVVQLYPADQSVISVSSHGGVYSSTRPDAKAWGVLGRSVQVSLSDGGLILMQPEVTAPRQRKLRMEKGGTVAMKDFTTGAATMTLTAPTIAAAASGQVNGCRAVHLSCRAAGLSPAWYTTSRGQQRLWAWQQKQGISGDPSVLTVPQIDEAAASIKTLKPDGKCTVHASFAMDSLQVHVSSSGEVGQENTSPSNAWPSWLRETSRGHSHSSGSVVRHLQGPVGGLQHHLYGNGSTAWWIPDGESASQGLWLLTSETGQRTAKWVGYTLGALPAEAAVRGSNDTVRVNIDGRWALLEEGHSLDSLVEVVRQLPPCSVHSSVDAESGALVSMRFEAPPCSDPEAVQAVIAEQTSSSKLASQPTPVFKKARDVLLLSELQAGLQREHEAEAVDVDGGVWSGAAADAASVLPGILREEPNLATPLPGAKHPLQLWHHPHISEARRGSDAFPPADEGDFSDPHVFGSTGKWDPVGQLGRTVVIKYPTGTVVAIHADGTHIVTEAVGGEHSAHAPGPAATTKGLAGTSRTLVTCPGFATVEYDRSCHDQFTAHAAGDDVALVAVGTQTRAVVTLPDETVVAVDYDCSVTALTNGFLRVHFRDGRLLTAADGGMVAYRGVHTDRTDAVVGQGVGAVHADSDDDDADVAALQAPVGGSAKQQPDQAVAAQATDPLAALVASAPRDDESESDHDVGVFEFDLSRATLQMRDAEANVFSVDHRGKCTALLAGDIFVPASADGSSSESIIHADLVSPRPPLLFLLGEDGSAAELLSQEAWKALTLHTKHTHDVEAHFVHGMAGTAPHDGLAGLPSGSNEGKRQTASAPHARDTATVEPAHPSRGNPSALPPPAVASGTSGAIAVPSYTPAVTALPGVRADVPAVLDDREGPESPRGTALLESLTGSHMFTFTRRVLGAGGRQHSTVGLVSVGGRTQLRASCKGWIQPADEFVAGMVRRARPTRHDVFGEAAMPAPAIFDARSDAAALLALKKGMEQESKQTVATDSVMGMSWKQTRGTVCSRSRLVAVIPELVSSPPLPPPPAQCVSAVLAVEVLPPITPDWVRAVQQAEAHTDAWREEVVQAKYQFKVIDPRPQGETARELEIARAILRIRALAKARAKKIKKEERRRKRRARLDAGLGVPTPKLASSSGGGIKWDDMAELDEEFPDGVGFELDGSDGGSDGSDADGTQDGEGSPAAPALAVQEPLVGPDGAALPVGGVPMHSSAQISEAGMSWMRRKLQATFK